jgi:sigma-B regulation protein RsbU (phosphoserine phosphatase)
MKPAPLHRSYFFLVLVLGAIAASQGIELFVNRVLRPDAEEITWVSDAILAVGFVVVTWLWVRLRETQVALTDLERQQIVTETQLTIAARVQRSLLPALPGPSAGISWYAAVEPAGKIGGDYYDFLPLPDGRMCVVVADVSGKGVGAAVFLANVRAILHALARAATEPRTLVANLSSALLADSTSGLYVTCIVAIVDPERRSLAYVNAGHPAGVLWNPAGARSLRVGGPPAGLLANAVFEQETLAFGDGDVVVFVSDGITEALNASGDAAVDVIAAQIEQPGMRTPDAVCARLMSAARRGPGPQGVDGWADDRTAVVFGVVVS